MGMVRDTIPQSARMPDEPLEAECWTCESARAIFPLDPPPICCYSCGAVLNPAQAQPIRPRPSARKKRLSLGVILKKVSSPRAIGWTLVFVLCLSVVILFYRQQAADAARWSPLLSYAQAIESDITQERYDEYLRPPIVIFSERSNILHTRRLWNRDSKLESASGQLIAQTPDEALMVALLSPMELDSSSYKSNIDGSIVSASETDYSIVLVDLEASRFVHLMLRAETPDVISRRRPQDPAPHFTAYGRIAPYFQRLRRKY